MAGGATAASNVELAVMRQPTLSHHHPAPSPSAKRLTGGGTAANVQITAAPSEANLHRNSPVARVLTKLTVNTAPGTPKQVASTPTGSPPPPLPSTPAAAAATRITPSTQSSMSPPAAAAAAATPAAMDRSTSLKLEAVMRRNTKACICTLVISTTSMAYCSAAMIVNEPHMRKLVSPLALIDSCLIVSMLCYVLSGSSKTSGDAAVQPTTMIKDKEGHITSTARPSGVAQPSKGGWVGGGGGGGGGASRVGGGGVQPVISHAAPTAAVAPSPGLGPARRPDPMIVEADLEAGVGGGADPRDLEQVDEMGAHDDAGIED